MVRQPVAAPQPHYAMNTRASRERRKKRTTFFRAEEEAAKVEPEPRETDPGLDWHRRLTDFPDPWLFDSEKLLREIDRIRELMLMVPNNGDVHATHFALSIAIDAAWNLRQTLRHLLHVHREGQRAFAKKARVAAPAATPIAAQANRRRARA